MAPRSAWPIDTLKAFICCDVPSAARSTERAPYQSVRLSVRLTFLVL
jgi:hypothetical protein